MLAHALVHALIPPAEQHQSFLVREFRHQVLVEPAAGGRENAFTGQDYTAYYQQLEKSQLPLAMKMEADRMANLRLTDEEFAKEIKRGEAKIAQLEVPDSYVVGRIVARDIVNKDTGEVLVVANSEIKEADLPKFRNAGIKELPTLYVNDVDKGPYVSTTLNIDPTRTRLEALVEIYRMMRPGEPPTKDAAETLFNGLFFSPEKYDLSAVGRMKFNRRLR